MQPCTDFQTICICAVRYALGRRTYVTGIVADFVSNYIKSFDRNTLSVILRDIDEAHDLGDTCDAESWLKLRNLIRVQLSEE